MKPIFLINIILISLAIAGPVIAQETGHQDIAMEEKAMLDLFYEMSSLPTRTPQMVAEVPAIMTVVSAEEIEQMGARDLKDVLAHIPGMQLGIRASGYPQLTFRGMPSHGAEKIKFLIDGHNVDINLTGGSALFFVDLSVDYIQKVEILHGPGSALYGSDALLGVINIVTRKELHPEDTAITTRFGSYDSQRYNIEYGRTFGALNMWANVNYYNTNGPDVRIKEDGLYGTPNEGVSNAPGNTNEWVERSDFSFGANLGNWNFQGQYLNHRDGGYFNPGFSLTDDTSTGRDYFWSDLSWQNNFFDDLLSFRTKIIYNLYNHDFDVMLQPVNWRGLPGPGLYQNGKRSLTEADVEDFGAEIQNDLYLWEDHIVTLGGEWKKTRIFDVTHKSNYDNSGPLPTVQDVSDYFNWIDDEDRNYYSFYLQDQWQIRSDVLASLGARYDHYDDFGSAFSPSLGVNWQFHQGWHLKLTYGEAFRAPSFRELYKLSAGSPLLGNPDLDAEEVESWQAAIEWDLEPDFTLSISGYWNEYDNTIMTEVRNSRIVFTNGSDSRSRGIDLVGKYRLPPTMPDITISGSLSYIDSEPDSGNETPGVASWLSSIGFNWNFATFYTLDIHCRYVGEVPLEEDDTRDDVDDYILTDLALTIKDTMGHIPNLNIGASVHNLFDVHYAYPEINGKLPDNYERPGITAEVWMKYSF